MRSPCVSERASLTLAAAVFRRERRRRRKKSVADRPQRVAKSSRVVQQCRASSPLYNRLNFLRRYSCAAYKTWDVCVCVCVYIRLSAEARLLFTHRNPREEPFSLTAAVFLPRLFNSISFFRFLSFFFFCSWQLGRPCRSNEFDTRFPYRSYRRAAKPKFVRAAAALAKGIKPSR